MHIFDVLTRDNVKARKMLPDSSYARLKAEGEPVDSQSAFIREAYESAAQAVRKKSSRVKPTLVQKLRRGFKKRSGKQFGG